MYYYLIEEASEAIEAIHVDLNEAIREAKLRRGKYLVANNNNEILFDNKPNITYKF